MLFFEAILTSITNVVFLFLILGTFFISLYFSKKGKATAFVQYAPNLLTTIGIFGTFFGIVLGLQEFNQHDIEASIPPLLAGLKSAFFTSLAGMLSSLLLKTLSTTSLLKPKQQEEVVSGASPEMILETMQAQLKATQSLQEALVGQEESTLVGQVKLLRSDVIDQVKLSRQDANEHFEKQQAMFNDFSDSLWIKFRVFTDTLSKSATEQVIEALKQVIVDFNNNLTEQFGENFKQLNEAVYKLVEWQELYKVQLEQMNEQYEHGVLAITATENSVAHISENTQLIPQTMADLKALMDVNQHQISELERHLEAFKDMRDRAVDAVPEVRRQVEETVSDISAAVATASEHYQELLSESDKYIQNHVATSEHLLEKLASEMNTAATEFGHNTTRTNESLKFSSDNLRHMADSLVDDAQSINKTMQDANQNLITDTSKARDGMLRSTEQLQKQLDEMIENTATQQINQAKQTFAAIEEQIRNQVGLTGEAVDNQLQLIDESMQKEVTRVLTEMGHALAKVSGQFTRDYTKLTKEMNDIIRQRAA